MWFNLRNHDYLISTNFVIDNLIILIKFPSTKYEQKKAPNHHLASPNDHRRCCCYSTPFNDNAQFLVSVGTWRSDCGQAYQGVDF